MSAPVLESETSKCVEARLLAAESYLRPEPRRIVGEYQFGVVKLCDGGNEAEAQSAAGCATAALKAIESFEHALACLGRNAFAAIAHDHACAARVAANLDGHAPRRRPAIFDRVVDEVRERVEQQIAVGHHNDAGRSGELDRAAAFL